MRTGWGRGTTFILSLPLPLPVSLSLLPDKWVDVCVMSTFTWSPLLPFPLHMAHGQYDKWSSFYWIIAYINAAAEGDECGAGAGDAEPTLASAFAQGEINNTFIYTYVRYECVCNSFSPDFLVFFGNCHNAPLVKAVVKWKMNATIIVIEANRPPGDPMTTYPSLRPKSAACC